MKKRVLCCLGLGLWIPSSLLWSTNSKCSHEWNRRCRTAVWRALPSLAAFPVIFGHKKHHSNHDGQVWCDGHWMARFCNLLQKNRKICVQHAINMIHCDSCNSCAIQAQNRFNLQFVLPSWRIITYCIANHTILITMLLVILSFISSHIELNFLLGLS